MSEQNVKLVQEIYGAFGRGDVDRILDAVSNDTAWGFEARDSDVPWHKPVHGKGELPAFFGALGNIEMQRFEPTSFLAGGDDVVVNVRIRYRVKKNGRVVEMDQLHRWTIQDGKVTAMRHFEDTAQVLAAWRD